MVDTLLPQFAMIPLGIDYLPIPSNAVEMELFGDSKPSLIIFHQGMTIECVLYQFLDVLVQLFGQMLQGFRVYFYPFAVA